MHGDFDDFLKSQSDYSLNAFDDRVPFFASTSDHNLVRVRELHYLRVGSCITITQSHTHTMQQMYTHKAVTGGVETKKSLSHRWQSKYSKSNLITFSYIST